MKMERANRIRKIISTKSTEDVKSNKSSISNINKPDKPEKPDKPDKSEKLEKINVNKRDKEELISRIKSSKYITPNRTENSKKQSTEVKNSIISSLTNQNNNTLSEKSKIIQLKSTRKREFNGALTKPKLEIEEPEEKINENNNTNNITIIENDNEKEKEKERKIFKPRIYKNQLNEKSKSVKKEIFESPNKTGNVSHRSNSGDKENKELLYKSHISNISHKNNLKNQNQNNTNLNNSLNNSLAKNAIPVSPSNNNNKNNPDDFLLDNENDQNNSNYKNFISMRARINSKLDRNRSASIRQITENLNNFNMPSFSRRRNCSLLFIKQTLNSIKPDNNNNNYNYNYNIPDNNYYNSPASPNCLEAASERPQNKIISERNVNHNHFGGQGNIKVKQFMGIGDGSIFERDFNSNNNFSNNFNSNLFGEKIINTNARKNKKLTFNNSMNYNVQSIRGNTNNMNTKLKGLNNNSFNDYDEETNNVNIITQNNNNINPNICNVNNMSNNGNRLNDLIKLYKFGIQHGNLSPSKSLEKVNKTNNNNMFYQNQIQNNYDTNINNINQITSSQNIYDYPDTSTHNTNLTSNTNNSNITNSTSNTNSNPSKNIIYNMYSNNPINHQNYSTNRHKTKSIDYSTKDAKNYYNDLTKNARNEYTNYVYNSIKSKPISSKNIVFNPINNNKMNNINNINTQNITQTSSPNKPPSQKSQNTMINIQELLLFEEKFTQILYSINNLSTNLHNECFELITFFQYSFLCTKFENYFKLEDSRLTVHNSLLGTFFTIILIYDISFSKLFFKRSSSYIINIIQLYHKSYLLLCEYILTKIASNERLNIYVQKLRGMLDVKLVHVNQNNNEFINFIRLHCRENNNMIINEIKFNNSLIVKLMKYLLKNYMTIKNTDEFLFFYQNISDINIDELVLFFRRKILRVMNSNASILGVDLGGMEGSIEDNNERKNINNDVEYEGNIVNNNNINNINNVNNIYNSRERNRISRSRSKTNVITDTNTNIKTTISTINNNYQNSSNQNQKNKTIYNDQTQKNQSNTSNNNTYNNINVQITINNNQPMNIPYLVNKPKKEFSLVLDLDETLICFQVDSADNNKNILQIRPFVKEFLNKVYKYYELIIFTSGTKDYADPLLDIIEKKRNYFDYRLYRQHTIIVDNDFVKDLSRIGRDLSKIIIVDNMPQNFRFQKENGIYIKSFWGNDPNDNALHYLGDILEQIAINFEDVREGIYSFKDDILSKVTSKFFCNENVGSGGSLKSNKCI